MTGSLNKATIPVHLTFWRNLDRKDNLIPASQPARAVRLHQIEWVFLRVSLGENQLTQSTNYLSFKQNCHHT